MTEDARRWDAAAGTARWLRPDEQIRWRGRPDAGVVFAPSDVVLVPVSLAWSGVLFLFATTASGGWGGVVISAVLAAFGAYVVVGRFVAKWWRRRRTRYAVTSARAVVVTGRGATVLAAPLTAAVEVRRRRHGRHGTAVWMLDPVQHPAGRRRSNIGTSPAVTDLLRGTGWPLRSRRECPEVAFEDVADVAGLVTALHRVGSPVTETTLDWRRLTTAPAPDGARTARPAGGPLRAWWGSRLGRHPYVLRTPLEPGEVAGRLERNLVPVRSIASTVPPTETPYQGSVTGRAVHLVNAGYPLNVLHLVFEGEITSDGSGSVLAGSLGPPAVAGVIARIWLGLASLLLLGGLVGTAVDLTTGGGITFLLLLVVPVVMVGMFLLVVELGSWSAAADWRSMERWLRQLLSAANAPGPQAV